MTPRSEQAERVPSVLDPRSVLAEAPIFRELPAALRNALADRFVRRLFRRGEVLFVEGSPATGVHLVGRGRIKVVHETSGGRAVILRVHGPGELLDLVHATHPATAVALDAGVVLLLPRVDFEAAREHPAVARALLAELTRRLGQAEERIRDLQTEPVEPRLARVVLRLARPTVALTRQTRGPPAVHRPGRVHRLSELCDGLPGRGDLPRGRGAGALGRLDRRERGGPPHPRVTSTASTVRGLAGPGRSGGGLGLRRR